MRRAVSLHAVPAPGPRPTLVAALAALLLCSCPREPDVVAYIALDQEFSEVLIDRFERETGLVVDAVYDTEASKTVGHVAAIRAEKDRPRCDVFWNNEIANTIALKHEGLLQPYDSPSAAGIPAGLRDSEHYWTGFAARARILIANTDELDPAELKGMWDLLDPRWEGRTTIARPLTGTTLSHMAVLYSVLGEDEAERYLTGIVESNAAGGVNIASSNGQTMRMVREGKLAFGWTDTDDFNVALTENFPVTAVLPDQGEDQPGMLVIPNTVAMVAGAPHPEGARRLIDFLLDEDVEAELAKSRSAQIPVRASVSRPEGVVDLSAGKLMPVDWDAVGRELPARTQRLRELFQN